MIAAVVGKEVVQARLDDAQARLADGQAGLEEARAALAVQKEAASLLNGLESKD